MKNGNPRYCSVAFVIPFYVTNCAIQRTCEPQRVAVGRPCRYRFSAMEEQQVVVLGVLRVCFFVASRGRCAPCCVCCAFCAVYMLCLCVASERETSRCSHSAEASPGDQR